MTWILHFLLAVLQLVQVWSLNDDWRSCNTNSWVPYREDGKPNVDRSFYACRYLVTVDREEPLKPGWKSSIQKCKDIDSSLAWWKHWKELAFYYNAFQTFTQSLSSADYFMVFMNLRDKPFPLYESYYTTYDVSSQRLMNQSWNYDRNTMIRVQHRRFVQDAARLELEVNCAAFRMEKNDFIESDIEFVPCDEATYRRSVFDIQNDMEHFMCRKERAKCPQVLSTTLGANVRKINGIYSYYYATMRNRQQQPKPNFTVNITRCHKGCTGAEAKSNDVNYFAGDFLMYWCEAGKRTQKDLPSQNESYAVCSEEGQWIYTPCKSSLCNDPDVACENGGQLYKVDQNCQCDCVKPWSGETCAVDLHAEGSSQACTMNICMNNGLCIPDSNSPEGFRCKCKGAMGDLCEYELNECSSNPCSREAVCVDELNGYKCICDTYWQGVHCTEVIPNCKRLEEPCKNGAACYSCNLDTFKGWCAQENATNYICNCNKGYASADCSIPIQKQADAWQIFAVVLGCMLFIIVSLFCEIIGSRRRHDHDNLQVLLESIDGYLKQRKDIDTGKRFHAQRAKDDELENERVARARARFRGRGRGKIRGRGRGLPLPNTKYSVGTALASALSPSTAHDEAWTSRSPSAGFFPIRSSVTDHGK